MSKRYNSLTALPSALELTDGLVIARNNILYRDSVSGCLLLMQPLSARAQANGYASLDANGKLPSAQLPTITLAKGDVGLGNVDNTSDANKPVSSAQSTAIGAKEATANKGAANGYCGLDSASLVSVDNLPGRNKGIRSTALTTEQLYLTDAGKLVQFTAGSAVTCYVMDYTVADFPIGTVIDAFQSGSGQVSFVAGGQASLLSAGNKLKIAEQNGVATLIKVAQNTWALAGNLSA